MRKLNKDSEFNVRDLLDMPRQDALEAAVLIAYVKLEKAIIREDLEKARLWTKVIDNCEAELLKMN